MRVGGQPNKKNVSIELVRVEKNGLALVRHKFCKIVFSFRKADFLLERQDIPLAERNIIRVSNEQYYIICIMQNIRDKNVRRPDSHNVVR